MNEKPGYYRYQAYILRIWQETAHSPHHFLLEEIPDGKQCGFVTLESLYNWLADSMESTPSSAEHNSGSLV